MSILNEQKLAMLKEAERAEQHRVFVEDKLADMSVRVTQVESTATNLVKRVAALEKRTRLWESLEERYETVLSQLVGEAYSEIRDKFKQEVESLERDVAQQRSDLNKLNGLLAKQDVKFTPVYQEQPRLQSSPAIPETRRSSQFSRYPTSGANRSQITERPVQRPGTYSGDSLWESYLAQFEITAQLNGWSDELKAAYLATSLTGSALNILGNLPPDRRRDYQTLVAALESRFGSAHRTELSRI